MTPKTEVFTSGDGARIYRIPIHLFPELWGYAHLVVADEIAALIDVGSGFGDSNNHLELGMEAARSEYGEAIEWSDLTHVLITHGHIDHFGGLAYVRERTSAPIGIHELDRRVLTGYEERLATVAGRLSQYLIEAGVTAEEHRDLMDLYLLNKQLFTSQPVDITYEAAGMQIGPIEITHVPGHTPGQVVMLVHDVLLSADHILERISPHLAPERLTLTTGLDHYLRSLEKCRSLVDRTKLVLGGHEGPFRDLSARIDGTRRLYEDRLTQVLDLARTPKMITDAPASMMVTDASASMTIAEIALEIFGETAGYHRLLALEEAGAYVEYLSMRGFLRVDDLESLERKTVSPIRYHSEEAGSFANQRSVSTAVGEDEVGEFDVRI
jgi:glyoxylase-like metal-dependent hydrolase (beta-lactamase superfamily II)